MIKSISDRLFIDKKSIKASDYCSFSCLMPLFYAVLPSVGTLVADKPVAAFITISSIMWNVKLILRCRISKSVNF